MNQRVRRRGASGGDRVVEGSGLWDVREGAQELPSCGDQIY